MKTVRITQTFTGYPDGKTPREFAPDAEPSLDDAFADLLVGKGLAVLVKPEPVGDPKPVSVAVKSS